MLSAATMCIDHHSLWHFNTCFSRSPNNSMPCLWPGAAGSGSGMAVFGITPAPARARLLSCALNGFGNSPTRPPLQFYIAPGIVIAARCMVSPHLCVCQAWDAHRNIPCVPQGEAVCCAKSPPCGPLRLAAISYAWPGLFTCNRTDCMHCA
jgi:hypothetical protein